MKIASFTCTVIGLLGGLMAALTALEVSPAFVGETSAFGDIFMTTLFWGGLSAIFILAAIAFGVITDKDWQ